MKATLRPDAEQGDLLREAAGHYWDAMRVAFLVSDSADPGDAEHYAYWADLTEAEQNDIAGTLSFAILEADVSPDKRVRA